jgi:tetratricopeptide (TPR) repeat protein
MDVERINNQVVVTVQGSKDPYVITADKEFARLQGTTPEQLAYDMMDKIRTTVDPSPTRDVTPDADLQTPQEKLDRANLYRQEADDAYSRKDAKNAEKYYLRALSLSPSYAVPYLRLADLYMEQGKGDKAKAILTQASAVGDMAAEDKATIAAKLRTVSQKVVSASPATP